MDKIGKTMRKIELLRLAEEMRSVSDACRVMGYSRPSYYRFKKLFETGGSEALAEGTRRKAIVKNRVDSSIERAVLSLSLDFPSFGPKRISNELQKMGIIVSATGVRGIWLRNQIATIPQRKAAQTKLS